MSPKPHDPADPFVDIAGHKYERVIDALREKGFVIGDPDGKFRPDDPLTRGEFCEAMARTLVGPKGVEAILAGEPLPPGLDLWLVFQIMGQISALAIMLTPASPVGTVITSPVPIWLTVQGARWDVRAAATRVS